MKIGLADWHYPHRSAEENAAFFLRNGFDYVSILGQHFVETVSGADEGAALAAALGGTPCTVHGRLPSTHGEADEAEFFRGIRAVARWQRRYGLIDVLSFDVPDAIRDHILPYLTLVLENTPTSLRVAVEDFGLTEAEVASVAPLVGNKRFGYLLDLGHMFIRFSGHPVGNATLFQTSALEANAVTAEGFLETFRRKTFPVFEFHLHNNDGSDDLHRFLEEGALDMRLLARAMTAFDPAVRCTIESAPGYRFSCAGEEADAKIFRTMTYWKRMLAEV